LLAFLVYALLWSLAFGLLWAGWADRWAMLALLCLLGFASTSAFVGRSASLQAQLDEARRGRVMGNIQMLSRGAGALGALLTGALADRLDFAPALLLLLALAVALFLASLLLARARRA
jgi:MFS family permease